MKQPIQDKNAPWRDQEMLEELYVERRMTQGEIAEQFDVAQKTISRWLNRLDVKRPWEDEELMRELYLEEMLTCSQMAKRFNCSKSTVINRLDEFGIERRDRLEEAARANRSNVAPLRTIKRGYECWHDHTPNSKSQMRVHRLVAIANHGFDSVCENVVHHKNGIPWDNRPENLEVMSPEEHAHLHRPIDFRYGDVTPREQYQNDG